MKWPARPTYRPSYRVLSMTDRSNGYEGMAAQFLAGRGRAPSTGIGARAVCDWARTLPRGAAVIDLGCGSGLPITKVLVSEDLNVYAIDASPAGPIIVYFVEPKRTRSF